MSLELEENVPSTEEEEEEEDEDDDDDEEEDDSDKRRSSSRRSKSSASSSGGSKKKKKKNQPGKYSQLVVDTIRKLGERNGSSLTKIYGEAKKADWFDQQNGRTYLKYSVKALVQNDTLVQVKGVGANGSFRLNKKKLEGETPEKKAAPAPKAAAAKKAAPAPKKSHKKAAKKESPKKSPKVAAAATTAAAKKKAVTAPAGGGHRKVKVGKPSRTRGSKGRKA